MEFSDFKKNMSDFIVNNFFCNNLSNNYMENNLLYIISMMLKDEIDQLKNVSEITFFLKETKVSYLLEQMIKMPDVQIYFKKIIYKMLEKIENHGSLKKIDFNMDSIYKNLKDFIEETNKKLNKKHKKSAEELCLKYINTKIKEQSMNNQNDNYNEFEVENMDKIEFDQNFQKYEKNILKSELEILQKEAEKNNKQYLATYYKLLINNIIEKNCDNLYSINFMKKYSNDKDIKKEYLLFIYYQDFSKIISFIEKFINDLLMNISIIPNSIKCICKIISILIKNKFKEITIIEENWFISKFFIEKLLIPILKDPSVNVLFNDFVLSENTQHNSKILCFILKYVFQGKLFRNNYILENGEEENYYTFFNRFILEENEKIIYFFQKIVNAKLPTFIEKFLNKELPMDYSYDYFTENPEEIFVSISICFNINNLICLIKGMKNSEKDLFLLQNPKTIKLKKVYEKFSSEEKIKELEECEKNEFCIQNTFKVDKKEKLLEKTFSLRSSKCCLKLQENENFYVYNEYEIEKSFENLFQISNKIEGFFIDIKKLEKKEKLDEKQKNLIKFKNYLTNSLMNYIALSRSSFKSTESVFSILSQMRDYLTNPNYNLNNNNDIIPSNWSISSVLNYMQKIPDEYKKNDYEKFFSELTQNLEDSISEINFEKIFLLKKKLQFLYQRKKYFEKCIEILEDIKYNEVVKNFVENSFCPIEVKFCYDDEEDERIFELKKSNISKRSMKNTDIIEIYKDKRVIFRTVSAFVRYFPDLNKYQDKKDINPFQIIKELSINKKIFHFFDIIKNIFISENICTEEDYNKIYDDKIRNYIMNKIYKKIYPSELENEDSKFFQKTMHLSWVEPNMIIPGDTTHDVLDNILPDILDEFKKLNKANSPYIKLKCIKKIFEYIGAIVKFKDGGEGEDREVGAEDIAPYLNYILIRACPVRIFSDINFIKLFLKNQGKYEYDFFNVEMMCRNILDSNHKNFNISESEYLKKCNEAIINKQNNDDKRFNEIIGRFEITNN